MSKKEHHNESPETEKEPQTQDAAAEAKQEKTPEAAKPSQSEKFEEELATARQERDRMQDKYLRLMAEFDNFKKRTQSEVSSIIKSANEELILQLLEVLDNFERALAVDESSDPKALRKGVELIRDKLLTILKGRGLEPYESAGKEFNPDEHEAMMQAPSADLPEHHVLQEIERGYRFRGKVLRPARVVVSKSPEEASPNANAGETAETADNSGESKE